MRLSDVVRTAFIGLGSNLDDPRAQLDRAVLALSRAGGIELAGVSSYYRSAPWGEPAQPDFINAVARVETMLTPEALLAVLQGIEAQAGRRRERRWGPRALDLDLLLHEGELRDTPLLQLPHPRMHERGFVLVPLLELAPEVVVPGLGRARDLLQQCGHAGVERLADVPASN